MLGWSSARYCVYKGQHFHVCVTFVRLTIQRTIWTVWVCEDACVWSVSYFTFEAQCGFNHESSGLASIIVVLWACLHLSQSCMELRLQSFINKPEIRMKEEEILLKSIKTCRGQAVKAWWCFLHHLCVFAYRIDHRIAQCLEYSCQTFIKTRAKWKSSYKGDKIG